MQDLKEYVVTAKTMDDATSLLDDMETLGGDLYIPNRQVEVTQRREISRNTHFMLTDQEAEQLRTDPRVLAAEQLPSALGMKVQPHWIQTGNFEKNSAIDSNDKNWGLYRVTAGAQLAAWGTNGSFTQTTQTVNTTSSGKNVDVIVVDAHINFNHPEFAVNADGTGGSRAIQYDWFQHSTALGYSTTGPYSYAGTPSSNHGTHTAGTCAGNTQGWARDSSVYNMEFNYAGGNGPSGDWALFIFDYIRQFHKTKSINTATGRRNPTISNNSWGYSYGNIALSSISSVSLRGGNIAVSGTNAERKIILEANGVPVPANTYLLATPSRYAALDADVEDAIADGVIIVASAGNSYWNSATTASADYNNYFVSSGFTYYHTRGSSPNSDNTISVGNISTVVTEYKAGSTNYGSRVAIYAPGSNIVSAVYDATAATEFGITLADDPRNATYKLGSISGTSMAGPQVAGCIACLLEQQPNLTQAQALAYLIAFSTKSQIGTTGGGAGDYTSLGTESNNQYLFYKLERLLAGNVSKTNTYKLRSATGAVYPRVRVQSVTPIVIATIPGAPIIGTATATGTTTATVAFTAPSNNGNTVITRYTATSSPGGITATLNQAGSGVINMTGLTASTTYTFTVTATNSVGTSSASSASNSITTTAAGSVPGAPTIGTATSTSPTTATVSFTAPGSNGGATITSYTATSAPGSITGTLNQAGSGTISVSGLVAGTSYTFTVTATNSIGTSNPSIPSNSITMPNPAPGGTTFVFQNSGFIYTVDTYGGTFPTLTLARGQTYTFNLNGISSSHPLALRLASGNTTAVPGTTGNNASSGVYGPASVTYVVPVDAPSAIYYQCVFHSSMIGTINIVG